MADKSILQNIHFYIGDTEKQTLVREQLYPIRWTQAEPCFHDMIKEWQESGSLGELRRENSLYVTDMSKWAEVLLTAGYPVLAFLHEGNRQEDFSNIRYAAEGFGDVEEEYFVKVYERLTGLPWHILDTERCLLRETTEEDVDAFYGIYSEPAITRYMEALYADREEEIRYIREYREKIYAFYGFGMWTVVLKETGEVIGRAGLSMREGFEEPELGFLIGVPWQGKGLAEEVCRGILGYGFSEWGFDTVQALAEEANTPSVSLCKKLGFTYAGKVFPDGREHVRMVYRHVT